MATFGDTNSADNEGVARLEKLLAAKRAKVEDLDTWADSLREEADANTQRASELLEKISEFEMELAQHRDTAANTEVENQQRLNAKWDDISHQVDELVSRVECKDFSK